MATEKKLMSFLNITDVKKRDSIVADYLGTVNRLQHRDINERAQDILPQDDLNRMFEPVVESTGKSTAAITKELVPIQEEMKTVNERLADTTMTNDKNEKCIYHEAAVPNPTRRSGVNCF